ncbi:MAG: HindVP family restriction endonuclease [Bacteroidetes bacterium]|nr:HindVP family restriction endonuclease [Bacteroidota bacterium]
MLAGYEFKLTTLPDESTHNLSEDKYGSEIVIRMPSIHFLACSLASIYKDNRKDLRKYFGANGFGNISSYTEAAQANPRIGEIWSIMSALIADNLYNQKPAIIQPIWKTLGKRPVLADNCLDVFVWSDLAFTKLFISESSKVPLDPTVQVSRPTRALIQLFFMLNEFYVRGNFDSKDIFQKLTYTTGINPRWFVMENVERINKTIVFSKAKEIFRNAGYGLTEIVLDASKCGVPQKRKRMFLIGQLDTFDNFLKQKILNGLSKESLTIRDYMGNDLGIENYYRHARSYARRGIFSIDEPSPTIRGVNRPIPPAYTPHPGDSTGNLGNVRPLTSVERSYIQTFPKSFKWQGLNKTALEQIIGNAVPVNLARYVGNCIMTYDAEETGMLPFGQS